MVLECGQLPQCVEPNNISLVCPPAPLPAITPTTIEAQDNMLYVIIGASVAGGVILFTSSVIVIVFLVRKRQNRRNSVNSEAEDTALTPSNKNYLSKLVTEDFLVIEEKLPLKKRLGDTEYTFGDN